MTNKRFLMGLLVMTLVFGIALVGCAASGGAVYSTPTGVDSSLNGTWVRSNEEMKFDNGNYEIIDAGTPLARGTYTASDGSIRMPPTEYYGGNSKWKGLLNARWYTRDQMSAANSNISDSQLNDLFSPILATYSISGNTLTMAIKGGGAAKYTRSGSNQSGRYMIVNTDTLNVRSGPSADNPIVGTLPRNTRVEVLDRPGQWFKIKSGNLEGYVNSSLLKDE
jgi:hypothetical protein